MPFSRVLRSREAAEIMGMLSALIDDAIDSAPFEGSMRPSPPTLRHQSCPICRAKIAADDLDSHVFNVHRHGLLLHTAEGDSRFRDAIRERQVLTSEQSIDCLEFCMQALALYAKGTIDWEEEKRLSVRDETNGSKLKAAFIQLLYLIYSEDQYHELSIGRYEDLKSIYPRLYSLPGAIGVASRAVIEIYFDWYECISTSQGPFFEVASLFRANRMAYLTKRNGEPSVSTRTIEVCVPNQMIRFIELASRAVSDRPMDTHKTDRLITEVAEFYRSCPSIYKPKAHFLASYVNARFSSSIILYPGTGSQASLVDVYGLDGATA